MGLIPITTVEHSLIHSHLVGQAVASKTHLRFIVQPPVGSLHPIIKTEIIIRVQDDVHRYCRVNL